MAPTLDKLYLNAGQMKAGTSYLYTILANHPQICFSPEKEIHWLCQTYGPYKLLNDAVRLRKGREFVDAAFTRGMDVESYRRRIAWVADYLRPPTTEGWYEDMFRDCRPGQWAADFSNLTCTIPAEGLRAVAGLARDVRVTYCIRDAVSRAFSHAKFHLQFAGGNPDLTAMEPQALRDLLLSDNVMPQSQSEAHVQALHDVFGDERLRIIRCESLWRDPEAVTRQLCAFLDIAPVSGPIPREAVNAGPGTERTPELMAVFEEIFGHLRARHEALLARHHRIVIG